MKSIRSFFATILVSALSFLLAQSLYASSFTTEQWRTTKGTQVVFYRAMEVPMLEVSLAFAAGSAYDDKAYGLSTLTTNLMNQGNGGMDATQIAERIADTGAQFNSETSRDMVVLNLKTLTVPKQMKQALSTFATIINKPDFPRDAFNREKSQQLLAIAQTKESPEDVANQVFFKALYLEHPYAHPINGNKDSVSAFTLEQVHAFYKQYFVSSNAILVMVGAIDSKQAHDIAEQLTANLDKGQPAPVIPKALPLKESQKIAVSFPSSQTILRLGQLGIDHHSPDYFPLTVGNYILGGGALISKLAREVREKRGLAYGVVSQFMPMPGEGPFIISLSTQNKEANTALKVTEDTLATFIKEGPSEKELVAAKQYLMGSYPLSLSSNANIANMLLRISFYKLPKDYLNTYVARINAVSATEIKRAFQKQIDPNKMLVVGVGKL